MLYRFYVAVFAIFLITFSLGCKDSECTKMLQCCAQVKDVDGIGQACGPLADQTTNPDSCRSVTKTVRYMLKDRKQDIPLACQ